MYQFTLPDKNRVPVHHLRNPVLIGENRIDSGISADAWSLMSYKEKTNCILSALSEARATLVDQARGSDDAAPAPGPVNPRTIVEL